MFIKYVIIKIESFWQHKNVTQFTAVQYSSCFDVVVEIYECVYFFLKKIRLHCVEFMLYVI